MINYKMKSVSIWSADFFVYQLMMEDEGTLIGRVIGKCYKRS